jgi:hypothetical protein
MCAPLLNLFWAEFAVRTRLCGIAEVGDNSILFLKNKCVQHYTIFAGPLSFDTKGYVDGLPKLMYNQDSWTKVNTSLHLISNSVYMAKMQPHIAPPLYSIAQSRWATSFFLILQLVLDFHIPTPSKDSSQVIPKLSTKFSSFSKRSHL